MDKNKVLNQINNKSPLKDLQDLSTRALGKNSEELEKWKYKCDEVIQALREEEEKTQKLQEELDKTKASLPDGSFTGYGAYGTLSSDRFFEKLLKLNMDDGYINLSDLMETPNKPNNTMVGYGVTCGKLNKDLFNKESTVSTILENWLEGKLNKTETINKLQELIEIKKEDVVMYGIELMEDVEDGTIRYFETREKVINKEIQRLTNPDRYMTTEEVQALLMLKGRHREIMSTLGKLKSRDIFSMIVEEENKLHESEWRN